MKILLSALCILLVAAFMNAEVPKPSRSPDERFKADLLLVVAHPDDESEIGPFLARAIFDEHKRVAVVFGTRGNGGGNALGQEQAGALASIREIEGRRALAYLGVTNVWFLDGPDTPGQDVLRSLETWDHGRSLGQLVRLVRLTRPDVIATWLPAYSAGENHGDHQAAGVIATEAFDAAGDPTQFPEQVTPPRDPRGISNLTEGLRPWQAQKLYYFSDASHFEFLKGQGPEYSATAISPSKKKSYAQLSAEECSFHLTQSDSGYLAAVSLEKGDLGDSYFAQPSRFIFGKSHVDGSPTGDIFEGVKPGPLAFKAPPGYTPTVLSGPMVELGGPWKFYRQFREAHGLEHLNHLLAPEVEAGIGTRLSLPILIDNPETTSLKGKLRCEVPNGWRVIRGQGDFEADGLEDRSIETIISIPTSARQEWQNVVVHASVGDKDIGEVTVRVHVASSSLPQ
jgi:LmbE family N-acetylglucosaminyl deacetylase